MHASDLYTTKSADLAAITEDARRENRLLRVGIGLALVLACAGMFSLALVDPDLWGHIRYAEDWLETGELPQTATHTFTATEHPWINHELLAELTLALGYRYLGINGLLISKCLLGIAIVSLMVEVARRQGVPWLLAWPIMLLMSANLHPFFLLRPQLLSFGLLSLVLVLLERAFRDWGNGQSIYWGALWMLSPIFAIWANSHGAFSVGLCITCFLLGGRIVEKVIQQRAIKRVCFYLIAVGLSCVAATVMNPYGIGLHRWLLVSLSQPRPEITEWVAPSRENMVFWPWVILMAMGVLSLAVAKRRRDWVKIAILAIVAWQSALHMRHIAILALLCGFWLPEYVYSALGRLRMEKVATYFKGFHGAPARRVAIVGLLAVIGWQSLRLDRQLSGLPVSRNSYPLDAVQFMADRGLGGKLVVSFNWAQYVVAALAPDVLVAFDGRFRSCYPQKVIDMNFDFMLGEFDGRRCRNAGSGAIARTRVLEHGSPDLVLIDRRYENAVSVMRAEAMSEKPCWALLYCDRVAEIWGRRERYDKIASLHYLPVAMRVQDPRPRNRELPWPALPIDGERPQLAWETPR